MNILRICGFLLILCTTGCGDNSQSSQSPSQSVYEVGAHSVVPTGVKGDPNTYGPNNGFTLDINGDGTNDSLMMNGDTVTWKRNGEGPDVPLLKVGFPVHAYRFQVPPGKQLVALYIFDANDNEFCAENLGNTPDGTPIFGSMEATK